MKVIMLEDVRKVGKKDEIITVSDGYANNYLIKNKLAVPYTKRSKEVLDKEINEREVLEASLVKDYNEIKKSLENKTLTFKVKTGTNDKVFGKISTKSITDELKRMGYNIDKKCIKLNSELDSLGIHTVEIVLHKKVSFNINIKLSK